jgi:DNA invertase Pin-like site-specific DNA recombinase
MNSVNTIPLKITTAHRAKFAYVYLRQSTLGQVLHNTESTARQYALVNRAVALGWPQDRVRIIDEDLGRSGSSAELRSGFQQLMAEIGLAQVGLVLSIEASRLSRNNSDWYRLLELCSIFGTLIADAEIVYDPRTYHDRILLGLAGIMSEAELHHIKMRQDAGKRSKAARGELHQALPVGLERLRTGEVILNPDEEIQARLELVFDKFRELGSARAVMRYLYREGLKVPVRLLKGPWPHDAIWVAANASNVRNILQNPAYAGAYVYGHRKTDPTRKRPGVRNSGIVRLPIDSWEVCLQDVYPAYISWEEFVSNQKRISANQNNYYQNKQGVAHQGRAMLQGIVLCGICGCHMASQYQGRDNQPIYSCEIELREYASPRCQIVRGLAVDAEVERLVLGALAPDRIVLALGALEQLESEAVTLERQWQLRIERARYEATRAQRQYHTCEPENRLVARTLEHLWEEKLRGVEEVEKEFQVWRKQHHTVFTADDRRQILAIGEDLPRLWSAPSTTNADRKQIIRLVIKSVVLDRNRERGKIWFKINWQTGATTEHWLKRRTANYREHADREQLRKRMGELNDQEKTGPEIAAILTAEGFRTTRGEEINNVGVCYLRKLWGMRANRAYEDGHNPHQWDDGTYSVRGIIDIFNVPKSTVYYWLKQGLLQGKQIIKRGVWKISLCDEQIKILREKAKKF